MKEFKVLVGTTEDHMVEVLHSGLRNDNFAENFPVNHINSAGVYFPIRFVRIVPLSAHQSNYHTSIWHVSLQGIKDPEVVERVRRAHEEYREAVVLRHLLKHLRQRRLLSPFDSLLSRSSLRLEHPLVTQLHTNVVLQGDWSRAEELLVKLSSAGLFASYLQSCQPYASFNLLCGTDADGDVPCPRGGHAMCIDPVNDQIYLHGGWDGEKCLDDFWMYEVKRDKWKVLSLGTTQEINAPGPRSCHKMVFDSKTGSIYLLGRLADTDQLKPSASPPTVVPDSTASSTTLLPPNTPVAAARSSRQLPPMPAAPSQTPMQVRASEEPKSYCSEFYRYRTRGADAGRWDYLSFDTGATGGPPLVFDHQMALDSEAQILYVFGGRIVDGDWDTIKCAGMYCYNVRKNKWSCLMPSQASLNPHGYIPPRFGHSMLLDPRARILYIFAGQRDGVYLSDMYAYDLKSYTVTEIFPDSAVMGGPDPSFAQRAVIDPDLKEIYMISGLTGKRGEKSKIAHLRAEVSYWVYRYGSRPGKWSKVLLEPPPGTSQGEQTVATKTTCTKVDEDSLPPPGSDGKADVKPKSRYAYQVVYNPRTKSIFMHGGNAGKAEGVGGDPVGAENSNNSEGPEASSSSNTLDAEKENRNGGSDKRPETETRLNDLWMIKLHRPASDIVIHRTKFHIRRQQYREMCEEQSAAKALSFLQNEVAAVVDHSNAQESEEFRSLMTHLLVPSATAGLSSRTSSASTVRATRSFAGPDMLMEGQRTPELYPEERSKATHGTDLRNTRSRPFELYRVDEGRGGEEGEDEELSDNESEDEDDGDWTNQIGQFEEGEGEDGSDGESVVGRVVYDKAKRMSVNPDGLLDVPDHLEFNASPRWDRVDAQVGSTEAMKHEVPSGLRYQQRTEVFESLLGYIDEEDKQPEGSLLDLVGEGGGGASLTGDGIFSVERGAFARVQY
ncbi:hypothetical protein AX17_004224 [Amanita inopinata Kibby_2008]|nr:hypothetical protein AX17_004224 [Amanita inopinata Kibby_2008]